MVNITHKSNTLRQAIATAVVAVSSEATIAAIKNNQVPKGNVFEMSKTAGLFAAKHTSDMIPDCHPLPIEYTHISFEVKELEIHIFVEVHTIYKTGVEVEAMHAASVVALTLYDMLKPIDKGIEGGKTDYKEAAEGLTAAVIVCSDSIFAGKKEDKAGKAIITHLERYAIPATYTIIADEIADIQSNIKKAVDAGTSLVLITGGTGLSPRDVTPEAVRPLLDREIDGIAETLRNYGQDRTPYAMLSRSVAGTIGNTLVIALPGSTKGASESMDALFPAVLHIFKVLKGGRHE